MYRKRGNTVNTQKDSAMTEFIKIRALANINPNGGVVVFFQNFSEVLGSNQALVSLFL